VIAALVFALNGGMATATLEGSSADLQYVTVDTGQSLWQVAETIAPNADPRDVIAAIMQLNRLESADVLAGQQLAIPTQYLP
jgi:LysM repeat protein